LVPHPGPDYDLYPLVNKVPSCRAVEADIDLHPDTLNLASRGRWVTCYIELPEGCSVRETDVSTVRVSAINGTVVDIPAESRPTEIGDYEGDGVEDLMVKFDRSAVLAHVLPDTAEITVVGDLLDERAFEGATTVRVVGEP
jgi:hypothetical protein